MFIENRFAFWTDIFSLVLFVFLASAALGLSVYAYKEIDSRIHRAFAGLDKSLRPPTEKPELVTSSRREAKAASLARPAIISRRSLWMYRFSTAGVKSALCLLAAFFVVFSFPAAKEMVNSSSEFVAAPAGYIAIVPDPRTVAICEWSLEEYGLALGHKESLDVLVGMLLENANSRVELPWENWIKRTGAVHVGYLESEGHLFLIRNSLGVWHLTDGEGRRIEPLSKVRTQGEREAAREKGRAYCNSSDWFGSSRFEVTTDYNSLRP